MTGSNLHYLFYERAIAQSSLERLQRRGAWPGGEAVFAPTASRVGRLLGHGQPKRALGETAAWPAG